MRGNESMDGVGVRWPWRRQGGWRPAEAAVELQRRLPGLVRELARRPAARGVPALAREEILLEAIAAVTVDGQPIRDERHLLGALWVAVEFRLRRWHEGRHHTRLGSQQRVPLDPERAPAADSSAQRRLEQLELARTAADHLADLNPLERQIIVLMASQSIGPLMASRQLDLPLSEVRSAARSGRLKLDRAAVIQQAGRMCHHRSQAIAAAAQGTATSEQQRQARAHLAACKDCGNLHRHLQHQTPMADRPRRALPALLPTPLLGFLHRLEGWVARRPTLPAGTSERTTQLAAGGGLAKAAAVTTAIIAATTTTTTGGLHLHRRPTHHPVVPAHPASATAPPNPTAPTSEAPPPAASTPPRPANSTTTSGSPSAEHPHTEAPSAAEREFTPAREASKDESETSGLHRFNPKGVMR